MIVAIKRSAREARRGAASGISMASLVTAPACLLVIEEFLVDVPVAEASR